MARAVLLRFDDNVEAEAFVRDMYQQQADSVATVEWVAGIPTKTCECNVQQSSGRRRTRRSVRKEGEGFTKGRRFGWWVHAACGKVMAPFSRAFTRNMINGSYDLLPEILSDLDPDRKPNDNREWDDNFRTKR